MKSQKLLNQKRSRRARRTRVALRGTFARPRLSVFRSHAYTSVQLIDDENQVTLVSGSTRGRKIDHQGPPGSKLRDARALGEAIAARARERGIVAIVFDRGAYKYHGRVRAVAEGLRKGNLLF